MTEDNLKQGNTVCQNYSYVSSTVIKKQYFNQMSKYSLSVDDNLTNLAIFLKSCQYKTIQYVVYS